MNQPSKTQLDKAARQKRKQDKLDAKARKAAELQALVDRANEIAQRLPAEFQDWGVTKTRAYCRLLTITKRRAALKRPPPDVLRQCISKLEGHASWSLDQCASLAQLPETASRIELKP